MWYVLFLAVVEGDAANYREIRQMINNAVACGFISHQDGFRLDQTLMNRIRSKTGA